MTVDTGTVLSKMVIRFHAIKDCVVVSWEIADLFVGVNVREMYLKITSAARPEAVSKYLLDNDVPIFKPNITHTRDRTLFRDKQKSNLAVIFTVHVLS